MTLYYREVVTGEDGGGNGEDFNVRLSGLHFLWFFM